MADISYVQVNTLTTVNIFVSVVYAIAYELDLLFSQGRLVSYRGYVVLSATW
jgi:hypothetical protein